MLFAGEQLFGRLGRTGKVTDACASAISLLSELLKSGPPRVVTPISDYTDAAYEPEGPGNRCGLGGILVGSDGFPLSFFLLGQVPEDRPARREVKHDHL